MITYPHLPQIKFVPLGDLTLMILEPWPEEYRKARSVKVSSVQMLLQNDYDITLKGIRTRKP